MILEMSVHRVLTCPHHIEFLASYAALSQSPFSIAAVKFTKSLNFNCPAKIIRHVDNGILHRTAKSVESAVADHNFSVNNGRFQAAVQEPFDVVIVEARNGETFRYFTVFAAARTCFTTFS